MASLRTTTCGAPTASRRRHRSSTSPVRPPSGSRPGSTGTIRRSSTSSSSDADGTLLVPGSAEAEDEAVTGIRSSTLAARLKAAYGSVDRLDAFVGMVSEQHLKGTEFGELQLAIWTKQFAALRDGDRFYYLNDPALHAIELAFRIYYRHSLAEFAMLDAGVTLQTNVFEAGAD